MHRGLFLRALGSVSLGLCLLTGTARGQSPAPLAAFQFLLGQWEGIGDQAGATGGFTLAPRVQGRAIGRANYFKTPAAGGQPPSRHDDFMGVSINAGGATAAHFDSANPTTP